MPEPAAPMPPPIHEGPAPLVRPDPVFLLSHPAHCIALGFGAGLSRWAPGTAGTLWAWVAFLAMQLWLTPEQLGWVVVLAWPLGWWASMVTARHMNVQDPGHIVWDEVAAFWLVLWLVMPVGFIGQLLAFGVFRLFDTLKPGPIAWADRLFHGVDPAKDRFAWAKCGVGIMLDDFVAACCVLLVFAAWKWWW